MTKEITKAIILQALQDKLKLRELDPEIFRFSEMVVPIYNISPHLGRWEVLHKTKSITSATSFDFFEVPENEQWTLRAYQVIYGATGAHKGSGVYIDIRPTYLDYIYLDLKKGQEVSYLTTLATPVVMAPNSRLMYLIDTYVSTQTLTIDIDVWKEEIR